MPSRRTAGRRRRCFGSTQATASKGAAFTYDDAETLNSSSVSHPCFLRLPQRHCCRPTRALNVFDIVMLKRHRGWSPWGEPRLFSVQCSAFVPWSIGLLHAGAAPPLSLRCSRARRRREPRKVAGAFARRYAYHPNYHSHAPCLVVVQHEPSAPRHGPFCKPKRVQIESIPPTLRTLTTLSAEEIF